LDKLRIAKRAGTPPGTAPVWAAYEAGLHREYDLDVELVDLPRGLEPTQALAERFVDLVNYSGTITAQAQIEEAQDQIVILSALDHLITELAVRPEITSVDQLRGATIEVQWRGVSHWIARAGLPRLGVDPDQDVKLVDPGRSPDPAWQRTDVHLDGLITHNPLSEAAEQAGWHVLSDLTDLHIPWVYACLAGDRAWIEGHRELVQRWLLAHTGGILRFQQDSAFAVEVLRLYSDCPPEKRLAAHAHWAPECALSPAPTAEGMRTIVQSMVGVIPGADPARADRYVDPRYVEELESSGELGKLRQRYGLPA
jgi:ABC-type nitrate/sulfonate/bicarbonate transport system substrate-binding protein